MARGLDKRWRTAAWALLFVPLLAAAATAPVRTAAADQAFFVAEGYQSPAVGAVETKRGTSDPTYLYYTPGKLEILKLRADVEKKEGANFDLERFHDNFMQHGFAPIAIVRPEMLHDDSPVL